ncbi:MAG: hypothetical protein PF505_02310 [Vallitaleaceae bacterium]|jgi:hypothetical protein|nr:hypothetical protein [Vallitaleaceae bacterium]
MSDTKEKMKIYLRGRSLEWLQDKVIAKVSASHNAATRKWFRDTRI